MKKLFLKYFLFCFLLFPQLSFAGWHLEPYAGAGLVFSSTAKENQSKVSWLLKGDLYRRVALGARAGWTKLGLALGLDLSGSQHSSIKSIEESFWTVLPGAFISYKLPLLFRAYGVIIPHGFFIKTEGAGNVSTPVRGVKLGISYLSVPFLSVNFEYQPTYLSATGESPGIWMHGLTAYLNLIF